MNSPLGIRWFVTLAAALLVLSPGAIEAHCPEDDVLDAAEAQASAWLAARDPAKEPDVDLDRMNVVMDAPWRVHVRSGRETTLPFMVFFPDTKHGWRRVRVTRIRVSERTADGTLVPLYDDELGRGVTIGISPSGLIGTGIRAQDAWGRFAAEPSLVSPVEPADAPTRIAEVTDRNRGWHALLHFPVQAGAVGTSPRPLALVAQVDYLRLAEPGRPDRPSTPPWTLKRRLDVLLDPTPLPNFAGWQAYDPHVHSIVEFDPRNTFKALRRNYGGPLRMLFESAAAQGIVPSADDVKGRLCVTDHNSYFSDRVFPSWGPTAEGLIPGPVQVLRPDWTRYFLDTDGKPILEGQREFENQDLLLGPSRGLELGLAKSPGILLKPIGSLSAHMLVYRSRQFVGPFHGGKFMLWREPNVNEVGWVLDEMARSPHFKEGFAYAAHPFTESRMDRRFGTVWTEPMLERAVHGGHAHRDAAGPDQFVFKGFQLWNERNDRLAELDLGDLSRVRSLLEDPTSHPDWIRGNPDWDANLQLGLERWHDFVADGLQSTRPDQPRLRLIRKTFMAGGSDAHGDFNRMADMVGRGFSMLPPLLARWLKYFWVSSNALFKVRTLAEDGPETLDRDSRPLYGFAHGQTVVTDGPVMDLAVDTEGRWDAATDTWHRDPRYSDADGRKGGDGRLDGERTCLVAADGAMPLLAFRWGGSEAFGGPLAKIEAYLDQPGRRHARVKVTRNTGPTRMIPADAMVDPNATAGAGGWRVVPLPGGPPTVTTALSLGGFTARLVQPPFDFRCYTNPVWLVPVRTTLTIKRGSLGKPVLPPGSVQLSFRFPISMDPRVYVVDLVALDGWGDEEVTRVAGPQPTLRLKPVSFPSPEVGSGGGELAVAASRGWQPDARGGFDHAVYTVSNTDGPLVMAPGRRYGVILRAPRDSQGNGLNTLAVVLDARRAQVVD